MARLIRLLGTLGVNNKRCATRVLGAAKARGFFYRRAVIMHDLIIRSVSVVVFSNVLVS